MPENIPDQPAAQIHASLQRSLAVMDDAAELMLEPLAALLETWEMDVADEAAAKIKPHKTAQSGTPRGDFSSRPPVQIHVHEDAKTGRMTVQTDAGERELSRSESERMHCNAAVCEHGGSNKAENWIVSSSVYPSPSDRKLIFQEETNMAGVTQKKR